MTVDANRINALRALVQWILRGVAVALLAWGGYRVVVTLIGWQYVRGMRELAGVTATLLVGAALGLLSRRIARWIITVPPRGCPQCGYPRRAGETTTRCPECGLAFAPGRRDAGD